MYNEVGEILFKLEKCMSPCDVFIFKDLEIGTSTIPPNLDSVLKEDSGT